LRGTAMTRHSGTPPTARRRPRRRAVAASVALALITTMTAGATSASGVAVEDIPSDPVEWATSPYSPLDPADVAAAGNSLELDFAGLDGGLPDAQGVGTGFTMVQPS